MAALPVALALGVIALVLLLLHWTAILPLTDTFDFVLNSPVDWLGIVAHLTGGLSLLLYGMGKVTETMKLMAGDQLKVRHASYRFLQVSFGGIDINVLS
jgi:hypothetical protein